MTGGERSTVPVKTAGEIPKALLLDCARALRNVILPAPIHAGDIVVANLLETGVDVIAVKDINIQ